MGELIFRFVVVVAQDVNGRSVVKSIPFFGALKIADHSVGS